MKIYNTSYFKTPVTDQNFISQWVQQLAQLNQRRYQKINVPTSLGNTIVWGCGASNPDKPFIFIFPGFRTSSLFWDLDNGLQTLAADYQIYLVETNGQPNLSDGKVPDIKAPGYGEWAAEVITHFTTNKVHIAGASFGGLVGIKLALHAPQLVDRLLLLNPGCLQPFSLSFKNLYFNLLPIISPTVKNVKQFLNKAVLYPPVHSLAGERMKLLIDYEVFALTRHNCKAQKPYAMNRAELNKITVPVYLVLGEQDLLFPYKKSIAHAQNHIKTLKQVMCIPNTGHGIETSKQAMDIVKDILQTV